MSVVDKYVDIANAIRDQYGTTDKYHLSDIPAMIDGLAIHNLFPANVTYDSAVDESWGKTIQFSLDDWNECVGKNITISFDAEWQGWNDTGSRNMLGYEVGLKAADNAEKWIGIWCSPDAINGKQHVSSTVLVPNEKITGVDEGAFFNQINSNAKVKATNFKLVINPMGGN